MNKPAGKIEAEGLTLQIRKIGNSVGLILPKDMLARLRLKEGDKLHIVDQTENSFKLTQHDPVHARTMEIARGVMDEYKDTFAALAK